MSSVPVTGRRRRVMLADELGESAVVVDAVVREIGYELARARTTPELMRGIAEKQPDLVLLDVGLADRTRTRLIEFLASTFAALPVVALVDDRQAALASLKAGARSALPKPLEEDTLKRTLQAELRSGPEHRSVPSLGQPATPLSATWSTE